MASSSTLFRGPRCKICNNLDYRGHEDTDLENNELNLEFRLSEFNHNCPFCRLVFSSIESVVDKDCWDVIKICLEREDGNETNATVRLNLVKDNPISVDIFLWFKNRPDVRDTGGSSEDMVGLLPLEFIIYSRDKVFCSPQAV